MICPECRTDSMAAFQPVSAEAIDGKKLLDVFSWGPPYQWELGGGFNSGEFSPLI